MASSRDVLNAFKRHVARLVEDGRAVAASAAWDDFLANVVPSFPPEHRDEAHSTYQTFARDHAAATGGAPESRSS